MGGNLLNSHFNLKVNKGTTLFTVLQLHCLDSFCPCNMSRSNSLVASSITLSFGKSTLSPKINSQVHSCTPHCRSRGILTNEDE